MTISDDLNKKLNLPCWFHGTEQYFDTWIIPPPPKPREILLVPHTAIFFTSDMNFAKGAGKRIAKVSISSHSKILDTTANYAASENLRLSLRQHQIASRTLNIQHDFWHDGWKTGDVLRMTYSDPTLETHLQQMVVNLSRQLDLPIEAANVVVQLNASRGLIELICTSAKKLGFDAIYGHEVDRHSIEGKVIAQPWLAVLSKGVSSNPEWV
ncbi:hypothetical protein [Aeromonas sp. Marseille-Q5825]|uniref:hypothetical protein n=1 Tax=Aeromonas TaxID=642 RepID=UPI0021C810DB|nr:hypothetical protein [Aeromonas sp. Marseille-Q5825]